MTAIAIITTATRIDGTAALFIAHLVSSVVEPHEGALDQVANEAINKLIQSREMVTVPIDTRLDTNSSRLRSAAEVESLIARMDLVITTRLHGLVLALKNGVPAVAIDPIPGGFKIERHPGTCQ